MPQSPDLAQGPPLPPSLSGQQADMPGTMGQGPDAPGSAVMQETAQTAMQVEMGLQQLASSLPGFAPIAQQIVQVMRMGIARSLQQVAGSALGTGAPTPLGAGGAGAMNTPPTPMPSAG